MAWKQGAKKAGKWGKSLGIIQGGLGDREQERYGEGPKRRQWRKKPRPPRDGPGCKGEGSVVALRSKIRQVAPNIW